MLYNTRMTCYIKNRSSDLGVTGGFRVFFLFLSVRLPGELTQTRVWASSTSMKRYARSLFLLLSLRNIIGMTYAVYYARVRQNVFIGTGIRPSVRPWCRRDPWSTANASASVRVCVRTWCACARVYNINERFSRCIRVR